MNTETRILISIGSNYNPKENIEYAKKKLKTILGDTVKFSESIFTVPVDMVSDRFINCICVAETRYKVHQLEKAFKRLERQCNRSKKNDSINHITLDIDILLYGNEKYHKDDWDREYVKTLLKKIEDNGFIIDPKI